MMLAQTKTLLFPSWLNFSLLVLCIMSLEISCWLRPGSGALSPFLSGAAVHGEGSWSCSWGGVRAAAGWDLLALECCLQPLGWALCKSRSVPYPWDRKNLLEAERSTWESLSLLCSCAFLGWMELPPALFPCLWDGGRTAGSILHLLVRCWWDLSCFPFDFCVTKGFLLAHMCLPQEEQEDLPLSLLSFFLQPHLISCCCGSSDLCWKGLLKCFRESQLQWRSLQEGGRFSCFINPAGGAGSGVTSGGC